MSFFSLKSNKEQAVVIFDVQSSLVRAAIVTYDNKNTPHHWYSASQNIRKKEHTDGTYLTKMMLRAIETLSTQIAHDGIRNIERVHGKKMQINTVHFVLSSPWAISHSKTVRSSYNKDTEISKEMITSIIDSEERSLRQKFDTPDFKQTDGSVDVIEKKIFEVKLNGYPVTSYEGRRAHTLEVSCAVTMSSHQMVKHIENALTQGLHPNNIEFHSALLLHYTSLRDILGDREEYISAHVHGELTDIVVVKKGMCSSIASYPFGSVTLTRKVAASLHQTESMADSTIALYAGSKLHDEEEMKVSKAVTSIMSGWTSLFFKSLLSATDKKMVPRMILLSCHSHYPLFERTLSSSEEWPANVIPFDETAVDKSVSFEDLSERSPLMGMYSLAIAPHMRSHL